jgi:hypothetical protein
MLNRRSPGPITVTFQGHPPGVGELAPSLASTAPVVSFENAITEMPRVSTRANGMAGKMPDETGRFCLETNDERARPRTSELPRPLRRPP